MSEPRIFLDKQTPSVFTSMLATAAEVRARADELGLSRSLLELVNVRVSQINRCAYCLDMHTKKALQVGETTQRLGVLPAWRETQVFTDRERAALRLAEGVTLVAGDHPAEQDRAAVREVLSADEVSVLTWAAITINAFNRVSIMSGHPVTARESD